MTTYCDAIAKMKAAESRLEALVAIDYKVSAVTLEASGASPLSIRHGARAVLSNFSIDFDDGLRDALTQALYDYLKNQFAETSARAESLYDEVGVSEGR